MQRIYVQIIYVMAETAVDVSMTYSGMHACESKIELPQQYAKIMPLEWCS